jgi:hypothetical protein
MKIYLSILFLTLNITTSCEQIDFESIGNAEINR